MSEISQTEKDKNHMILLICGIFKKKKWYKQAYLQNINRVRDAGRFLMQGRFCTFGFEDARDCVTKNVGSLEKVRVALDESQLRNEDFRPAVTQESGSPEDKNELGSGSLSSAPRQEFSTADTVISASPERQVQLQSAGLRTCKILNHTFS